MKSKITEQPKDTTSLGYKIYTLRTKNNMGQKEFAKYLHVSTSTISNYENNKYEPDLPTLVKIADYFNVSTDYLLNRTDYVYPLSLLEQQMVSDYTYSNILNTVIQLSSAGQTDLINYLDMLSLRDRSRQTDGSGNNKRNRKES